MTRLDASISSDHTILYTTPTGMTTGTIVIDFNTAGFVDGSVAFGDIDLSYAVNGTDNEQTLAAAAGDNIWGAVFADNELTLTYPTSNGTAIIAGWKVQIQIGTVASGGSNQMTNPAAGDDLVITITSGADSGSLAVSIGTDDQVSITATVTPTLSFDVTDTAVALGTLSATLVQTDTAAMTAGTNATGGYSITVFGPTLTSGTDTITKIGDPAAASNPGNEQFGMKIAVTGGGDGVAVSPYEDGTNYGYDADASADECAKSGATPGPSETNTFTMTYMANIATDTEAGSYLATHTYICTGTF